ncbi:MAG: hypothetical protein ACTSSA_15155 [Candidatus Freyarchaeota archaeon]
MTMSMFSWVYPSRYLSWEATDNCKSSDYPLKIYRYVPSEVVKIEQAILQFSIEKYRAFTYEKHIVLDDMEDNWSNWVGYWDGVDGQRGGGHVGDSSLKLEVDYDRDTYDWAKWENTSETFDLSKITGTSSGTPTKGFISYWIYHTDLTRFTSPPTDQWEFVIGNQSGGGTAEYDLKKGNIISEDSWQLVTFPLSNPQTADANIDWTNIDYMCFQQEHTNNADFTVYIDQLEAYSTILDIKELDYSNPSVSIKINGTDRTSALGGPWTSNQNNIDIAQYLSIGQWNTVELIPNQLMRLSASVIVTAIV